MFRWRNAVLLFVFLCVPTLARANQRFTGNCNRGGQVLILQGLTGSPDIVASFPQCTITVYLTGTTTLATNLSSDSAGLFPLPNPFAADGFGTFFLYAPNCSRLDLTLSGAGIPSYTIGDVFFNDGAPSACGGAAGGVTSLNSFFGAVTILPGTNTTVVNSSNTITINSTGGTVSGCSVTGLLDQWVLSVHPNATCYGSVDFTWNDGATAHNLQAGDGTNVFGTVGGLFFTLGSGNTSCTVGTASCSEIYSFGHANSLEGAGGFPTDSGVADQYVTGSTNTTGNVRQVYIKGFNNSVTGDVNAGGGTGNFSQIYLFGLNNLVTESGTNTTLFNVVCLLRACNQSGTGISASASANIDDIFMVGETSKVTSTGAGSNTSSVFSVGENNAATSSAGGNAGDIYYVGESTTTTVSGAASAATGIISLGFNNSIASVNGQLTNFVFILGKSNTAQTFGGGPNVGNLYIIGNNIVGQDCSQCYLFGTGFTNNGISNIIEMGLSATPEFQITAGHLNFTAPLNISSGINTAAPATGNTGFQHLRVSGCATAASLNATCDTTVTWTAAFANTSYTATCSGDVVTSGVPAIEGIDISAAKAAASITVRTISITSAAAQFTTIDCVAVHD